MADKLKPEPGVGVPVSGRRGTIAPRRTTQLAFYLTYTRVRFARPIRKRRRDVDLRGLVEAVLDEYLSATARPASGPPENKASRR